MNLHEQLKTFNVLTLIAIVIGMTLVFSLIFEVAGDPSFDQAVSALEIFDVSGSWPTVVDAAEFPFFAMGNFYDEFYLAFEQTIGASLRNIFEYSDSLAANYGRMAVAEQKNYSGRVMALSLPRGKALGLVIGDLTEGSAKIPDRRLREGDPQGGVSLSERVTLWPEDGVRDGLEESYSPPDFSNLFSKLQILADQFQP